MFAITLGTVASGSTWVFNVVRELCAHALPDTISLSAGDAGELLRNLVPGHRDIIVKAHHLDTQMIALAAAFGVRAIITTRDPRDSLVSQRERFGADVRTAVQDLSRSSATFAMLHPGIPTLELRYEEGFTDDPFTVGRIAAFLGLSVEAVVVQGIFEAHRAEQVVRTVDRLAAADRLRESGYDRTTLWHAGHVGDREVGKWRDRLPPCDQEAAVGAVGNALETLSHPRVFRWSARLFTYHDERSGAADELLGCDGGEQMLAWGPYLHLPTGRWQIRPCIEAEGSEPISIRIEAHIPTNGRDVLASRVAHLPSASPERLAIEFDHHDHLEPVELRIGSVHDGRRGRFRFSGAELERLGPSERVFVTRARSVGREA